jgi:hypothetical protein
MPGGTRRVVSLLNRPSEMGTNAKGFKTAPAKMTREELQNFVLGLVDHRMAEIEERLSEGGITCSG